MATSSGSTGVPTVSPFTQEDFDLWQDTEARLFWQAGMRPNDRYVHGLNFALYVGGPGRHRRAALGRAGHLGGRRALRPAAVRAEAVPAHGHLDVAQSYAWTLGEKAKEKGYDPQDRLLHPHHHRGRRAGRLHRDHARGHRGFVGREGRGLLRPVRHLRGLRRPCARRKDGLHIVEDQILVETVDPDNRRGAGAGRRPASWCTPPS